MHLKYIGYFDQVSNAGEGRGYALSAATKMEYIAEVLNRAGHHVIIISPSQTRHSKYFPGKVTDISSMTRVKLFPTFPRGNLGQRGFRALAGKVFLLAYLLVHTRRDEPLLVYHSLDIQATVLIARAIRRFRLVLEVEEVYQDVVPSSKCKRRIEYALFEKADAFIFSTELLNEKLNARNKPHAVIYGTYKREQPAPKTFDSTKTHIVYAGTLDPRKGGAAAVAAAAYLDDTYHVHILGFGSDSELAAIQHAISVSNSANAGLVTYDGVLKGSKYSEFLNNCDIGLSTQDPSAAFNDTSFPSKILSYLAHGLKVVTVRIPAVERSRIAPAVVFYDAQAPQIIAEAIKRASTADAGNPGLMEQLDREFVSNLARLIDTTHSSRINR